MSSNVDQEAIQQFNRDGATVLRGVFADWVDTLRAGIAANMDDPDPNARIYRG
ncbi:MAG: hypothetical protein AAF479_09725 [Pseudomonadota bacterium]